jgi:ribosomal protein L18E
MAEASQPTTTKKLDEILRRLARQPDVDDWHDMATMLSEVSNTVKNIVIKVDKLDTVVITGNGKPPLNQRMHDVEVAMSAISRIMWIVVGVLVTAVTYGAFRLINIP